MKSAGVAQLKAHLSEYLAAVKAGEEIQVTERGRPIARVVPIGPSAEDDARLRDLERAGLVKRPARPLSDAFWKLERGRDPKASVREAVAEEREAGR